MQIGKMIKMLETYDPELPVLLELDGEQRVPGNLHSWRGVYAHLAINWSQWDHYGRVDYLTVGSLVEGLKGAIGKTFEGYKGGDFVMQDYTPLWVADEGSQYPGAQPCEAVVADEKVIIRCFAVDI